MPGSVPGLYPSPCPLTLWGMELGFLLATAHSVDSRVSIHWGSKPGTQRTGPSQLSRQQGLLLGSTLLWHMVGLVATAQLRSLSRQSGRKRPEP